MSIGVPMIKIVKRLTQTTDMLDEELNLEDYVLAADIAKFKDTVAAHGLEYAIRNKEVYDSLLLVDKLIPFLNLYIDKVLKANTTNSKKCGTTKILTEEQIMESLSTTVAHMDTDWHIEGKHIVMYVYLTLDQDYITICTDELMSLFTFNEDDLE